VRDRHSDAVVKVDRRITWHYTTTILHLRTGARGIEIVNFTTAAPRSPIPDDSSRYARTISRHADGISRYSVPPSAGPLLPLLRCIGGRIGSQNRRVKKSGRRHISTSGFACSSPGTLLFAVFWPVWLPYRIFRARNASYKKVGCNICKSVDRK